MYCPRCAAQNIDDARFCRACGADILATLQQMSSRFTEGRNEEDAANDDVKRTGVARAADAEPVSLHEAMQEVRQALKPLTVNPAWNGRLRPPLARRARMRKGMFRPPFDLSTSGEEKSKPPKIEDGIQSLFWGIGMLLLAICIGLFMPGGSHWWFWMLLPAFGFIGGGVGELVRARMAARLAAASAPEPTESRPLPHTPPRAAFAVERDTAEIQPPLSSITEGTTRHLDAIAHDDNSHAAPPRRSPEN